MLKNNTKQLSFSTRFSNVVTTYDKHSIVQEKVFDSMLKNVVGNKQSIIDLGSGTGFRTKRLHDYCKSKHTVGLDQSLDMIRFAMKQCHDSSLHFVHSSIQEYTFKDTVDLIFSNATLHWISDIVLTQKLIDRCLNHSKQCVFSVFLPQCFSHLSQALNQVYNKNVALPCHRFHALSTYKSILDELEVSFSFQELTVNEPFKSVRDLLLSVKQTGITDYNNSIFLTPHKLQKLNELMIQNGVAIADYHIAIFNISR